MNNNRFAYLYHIYTHFLGQIFISSHAGRFYASVTLVGYYNPIYYTSTFNLPKQFELQHLKPKESNYLEEMLFYRTTSNYYAHRYHLAFNQYVLFLSRQLREDFKKYGTFIHLCM